MAKSRKHDHDQAHPRAQDPTAAGLAAKILTVSDGVAAGTRKDASGDVLEQLLTQHGYEIADRKVSPDGVGPVAETLGEMADSFEGLIVTTGGTGFGPRDLTPEATRQIMQREAPGLAEAMRLVNPLGRLSRATAGACETALIINTPGSPKGARECLEAVLDVLPHALKLLAGET